MLWRMKPSIHPAYGPVVFRDRAAGFAFLTRSTARPSATVVWDDGCEYPVLDVEVSSASHPLWTGRQRTVDTEGRVQRFHKRYADHQQNLS